MAGTFTSALTLEGCPIKRAITADKPKRRIKQSVFTCCSLFECLDLHVAELDPVAFGLEADVTAGDLAVVPLVGDGAVDPEGHVLALAGDLEGVPLAGGFDA